jgi:glutathione S-transferase
VLVVYGHPASGHAYKARLCCVLAGLPHEYRYVDLAQPRGQRRADFERDSPYGEVPTIVDDGRALAQSNAILMHLARTRGAFAGAPADWPEVTQWLCWEMNRVGLSVPNLRFHRALAPGSVAPQVLGWLEQRALADLATLERRLADRAWVVGAAPTIADLSLSAYLFWLDQAGLEPARWPAVGAWLDRIRALPGWQPAEQLLAA